MFGANNVSNPNVGQPPQVPGAGTTQAESPYMLQLRKQLADAQALQRQFASVAGVTPNPGFTQPAGPGTQQPVSPTEQVSLTQEQLVQQLPPETQMILTLFDEFAKTEDGRQLVSFIGKFNGFCQSKLAKGKT